MRSLEKYRYLTAAVITLIVFVSGALTANLVDDYRTEGLVVELQEDLTEIESNQMQINYLQRDEVSCEAMEAGLHSTVKNYNNRLGNLETFEERSLIKEERFEKIKHRYILSGIRYWMFAEEMRDSCDYSPNTVLFFTTNLEAEDCDECDNVGRQLSLLKQELEGDILIFSIPVNLDDGMIDILQDRYGVEEVPVMVINDETVLEGYHSRQAIRGNLQ